MLVSFQNMNDDQDGCLSDASNQSQPLMEPMKTLWLDNWLWSCRWLEKKKDLPPPVTWGSLKGLFTQDKLWGVATGHDITKLEQLLVCLLAVLAINSQGVKVEENYTHWSFVPHPPILHPRIWGEPLSVVWNNASHALGGRPLPNGYNISEQLQLSQHSGSFVGYPMCFCPLRDVNITCPIPCLQDQLNYRYTCDNSTAVGLLLSIVVPVNNCTDANFTRPPTTPAFLPHCPKIYTYAQDLSIGQGPWTLPCN
jgi:hypothetical protein